jgi:hypothetical protein
MARRKSPSRPARSRRTAAHGGSKVPVKAGLESIRERIDGIDRQIQAIKTDPVADRAVRVARQIAR